MRRSSKYYLLSFNIGPHHKSIAGSSGTHLFAPPSILPPPAISLYRKMATRQTGQTMMPVMSCTHATFLM